MRRVGIWLMVFGVLSFTLPHFGWDLKVFELLGDARDPVAGGLIVVDAALLALGWRRKSAASG